MSTIPKHFGLKHKEESYVFKELEKVRQETRKDFLRFKQKLASMPAVDEGPVHGLQAPRPGGKECVFYSGPRTSKRSPPAKGPATLPAALGQEAPPGLGEAAAPGKTRPFCPQDFYLRSSAFLRLRPQKRPPVIASAVGTSKPVVLLPPPSPPAKPRARRESPSPAAAGRVLGPGRRRQASRDADPRAEARKAKERKVGSISEDSDAAAASRRRRLRIRTHFVRQSSTVDARQPSGSVAKAERESGPPGDTRQAAQLPALLPARAAPRSIEDIIASQQSEAQLASDQYFRELIESVLGQNYDIKMQDIPLIGKMYLKTPQMQAETSHTQAEQGLQINVEEPQMVKHLDLEEAVSSVFQIEQEDVIEWGVSDAESIVFKSQEISEVQPAQESRKPLKDGQPTTDPAKQSSLKVKSSKFLQIKGKEVKRIQKSKLGVPPQRPTKSLKLPRDQKLPKKIPAGCSTTLHLHHLCTTIPAQELPVDLHLASRVYHTADKQGHDTLLGTVGTSFLDGCFTNEEQRD
ncbi:PREDICTED: tetratricopeptide repeat protein 6, partial [Galeopterus variegatus]|uniref:Tetratricopeptide repeat protein 6 n=1 Tax=Galeopterus variegatus TaxID=482537 RepID=A0ABM0RXF1_GALVR